MARRLSVSKGESVSAWFECAPPGLLKLPNSQRKNTGHELSVLGEYFACTTQLKVHAVCYCVCAVARRDRTFEKRVEEREEGSTM